mmetsp:Transcript_21087/g.30470  ORF Transcript_21087/g.30470 Transcript_21087/m.30470 type:complete len:458 (+) Transcript_21087:63-1436(+)
MAQSFTLKKAGADNTTAFLGRFSEPLSLDGGVFYMYNKNEEIKEDDVDDNGGDDKSGLPRKKKRRSVVKNKSLLVLEESSKSKTESDRVNMHGEVVDTTLDNGPSAKYAVLKMVKNPNDMSNVTVNVISIGDWYRFKKPGYARPVMSLEDVELETQKMQKLKKDSNERYKRITNRLAQMSAVAVERGMKSNDDEFHAPDLFGAGAAKTGRGGGGFKGHMNDGGLDIDEESQFVEYNGVGLEYDRTFSDDEDDVTGQQAMDEYREEKDVMNNVGYMDDEDEDSSEDEDDDSENGSDNEEGGKKDEAQIQDMVELREYRLRKEKGGDKRRREVNGEEVQGKSKKGRLDPSSSNPSSMPPPSAPTQAAVSSGQRTEGDSSSSSRSSEPKKGRGMALTEDLVRDTITSMGGRVTTSNLGKKLKVHIKNTDNGRERLKAILAKIALLENDIVEGKVLVLKRV